MGKGGHSSQTTTVDPATQRYVDQMRQQALGYAGGTTPLPPEVLRAQQQYGQYAQGGNLGFSALTGNADAAQSFMNPYTSQLNPFFAQQRALAVQGANDQATQMGAFGGDRSQIGAAVAGGQADQTQAGFQYDAFNQAMQRAGFASNLGFAATGAGAFLPQQYAQGQLGILNQGLGPWGQTQTTKKSGDWLSQLLGAAGVASSLGLFGKGGGGGSGNPWGDGPIQSGAGSGPAWP